MFKGTLQLCEDNACYLFLVTFVVWYLNSADL